MRASKLDRSIIIQRATYVRDGGNNPNPLWSNLITVRASKQDVRDAERIAAQQVGADITTRFQVRWNSVIATLDAKDRLICEGKTYQVVGVKEIERRVGQEITATARIDLGG